MQPGAAQIQRVPVTTVLSLLRDMPMTVIVARYLGRLVTTL